jgi:hypothetical protein
MKPSARLAPAIALGLAFLGTVGCGSKQTGDLSGTIKYKGKDVVTGTVTVYDADKKAYQGSIDQGKYSVKGIPQGVVTVVVVSADPGPAKGEKLPGKDRPGREKRPTPEDQVPITGWFALPKKYEDPATSPLKTTIGPGSNSFDISLTD